MKILILTQNTEKQHNKSHMYFMREIARQHEVRFFGPNFVSFSHLDKVRRVQDIIDHLKFKPDLIFTYGAKWNSKWLRGLNDTRPPWVHHIGDWIKGNRWMEKDFLKVYRPDLILVHNTYLVEPVGQYGPTVWLPLGVNTNVFKYDGKPRDIDVWTAMTIDKRFYPTREAIVKAVDSMPNSQGIAGYGLKKNRVEGQDYVDALCRSKIVVNCSSTLHEEVRYVGHRWYEATACGALLLTEPGDDMERLGFIPGENCATFESVREMKGKAAWYLLNPRVLARVAKKGMALTRKRHSHKKRVKRFTEIVEKKLKG